MHTRVYAPLVALSTLGKSQILFIDIMLASFKSKIFLYHIAKNDTLIAKTKTESLKVRKKHEDAECDKSEPAQSTSVVTRLLVFDNYIKYLGLHVLQNLHDDYGTLKRIISASRDMGTVSAKFYSMVTLTSTFL